MVFLSLQLALKLLWSNPCTSCSTEARLNGSQPANPSMNMPLHNYYIGQIFDELADVLEIEGANPFRVRAYRNAARVVTSWPQSLSDHLAKERALPKWPGLGTDLTDKVKEIVSTGRLTLLEEEEKRIPKELLTLLKI